MTNKKEPMFWGCPYKRFHACEALSKRNTMIPPEYDSSIIMGIVETPGTHRGEPSETRWIATDGDDDGERLEYILYCPYCGAKLEDSKGV